MNFFRYNLKENKVQIAYWNANGSSTRIIYNTPIGNIYPVVLNILNVQCLTLIFFPLNQFYETHLKCLNMLNIKRNIEKKIIIKPITNTAKKTKENICKLVANKLLFYTFKI